MSRLRPVIDVVSEYAKEHDCPILKGAKFVNFNGTRSVRFSEVKDNVIIIWDTGTPLGYVSLPRGERRPIGTIRPKAQQGDGAEGGPGDPPTAQERRGA